MNGMSDTNTHLVRAAAVSTVVAITLGISACTAGTADEPPSSGPAVALGEAPNQDVVELYTDRGTAVSAAVEALPQLIEKALERTGVPGAGVAVVSNGEVVFDEGHGVRNVTTKEPVDVDTVFQIASLSKPLSSSVVAKAITDDPDLSWDDLGADRAGPAVRAARHDVNDHRPRRIPRR